ncbi:MAG TPA: hypothetical protein VD902_19515 [Symbiobacteriaceae bacterium]|nr:hypothetical protein [Symbiobacteriaceae bacterium]
MHSIRCRCGKIVCQVDNMPHLPRVEDTATNPAGPGIVILCRHCKRYVVLQVPSVTAVTYASDPGKQREQPLLAT